MRDRISVARKNAKAVFPFLFDIYMFVHWKRTAVTRGGQKSIREKSRRFTHPRCVARPWFTRDYAIAIIHDATLTQRLHAYPVNRVRIKENRARVDGFRTTVSTKHKGNVKSRTQFQPFPFLFRSTQRNNGSNKRKERDRARLYTFKEMRKKYHM